MNFIQGEMKNLMGTGMQLEWRVCLLNDEEKIDKISNTSVGSMSSELLKT